VDRVSTVRGRMVRRIVLLTGALLALTAAPVLARSGTGPGNGLYDPFPTSVANSEAQSFYAQLGVAATIAELRRGVFRNGFKATADTAASQRGGIDAGGAGVVPLIGIAALALVLAALAARRRPLSSLP